MRTQREFGTLRPEGHNRTGLPSVYLLTLPTFGYFDCKNHSVLMESKVLEASHDQALWGNRGARRPPSPSSLILTSPRVEMALGVS